MEDHSPMTKKIDGNDLAALRQIDTATVANAIESLGVRSNTVGFMGWDVKCMFPDLGVMVGTAVTATLDTTTPNRIQNRNVNFNMYQAIENSPNPVVLVFKDIGPRKHHGCHFGDGLATICSKLGAIGLVTDGGVRDIDTVHAMGFHYFAPGAVSAHGNFGFHETQIPVEVSGVVVNPGDLIHADVNGIVCLPPENIKEIIAESHDVLKYESERHAWVKSGEFSIEKLKGMPGRKSRK